jgi:hypothetical protein
LPQLFHLSHRLAHNWISKAMLDLSWIHRALEKIRSNPGCDPLFQMSCIRALQWGRYFQWLENDAGVTNLL